VDAPVLSVAVPTRVERAMAARPSSSSPSSSPSSSASEAPADSGSAGQGGLQDVAAPPERHTRNWVVGGIVGLLALGVLWRSLRPH
jgi:hypothetical protein